MRDIKGYEGIYSVSEQGVVLNVLRNKIKKQTIGNHGYYTVTLFKENKSKTFLTHRLVAETFIKNENSLRTVNHKDGNKLNNKLDNLEWMSYSDNHSHSYSVLNRKAYMNNRFNELNHNSKKILMFDNQNNLLKEFPSIMQAERETGIKNNNICNNLKGRSKTCRGYIFKYK